MSTRPRSRAASRAEARRRARLAARGDVTEPGDEQHTDDSTGQAERRTFLTRIFPPAPPLPGRPDPLRGFDRQGPMRAVRERGYLLRQNLWAWIPTGLVAFLGFYASFFYGGSIVGLLATFAQFGALIAAGWFGWQRPTLYGTAAGVMSGVITTAFVLIDFMRLADAEALGGPGAIAANAFVTVLYQAAFGFLGGWYGGYLRRRQAQLSATSRRR